MPDEHTIADTLQRLRDAKTAIGDAITAKGGTVAAGDGLEEFPTAIGTIPTGSEPVLIAKTITENDTYNASDDEADGYSSVTVNVPNTYDAGDEGKVVSSGELVSQTALPGQVTMNGTINTTLYNSVSINVQAQGGNDIKPVRFYDYDGTLVASYTPEEFAALEAMPVNPTHTGLISQGWNWTLSDAKTFVANNSRIDIGQMYVTDDGRTRLYISLREGRTRLRLSLNMKVGTVVDIDWGDESEHGTLRNSGTSRDRYYISHTYPNENADYVISFKVTSGNAYLYYSGSQTCYLLYDGNGSPASADAPIIDSIKRIELGSDFTTLDDYALPYMYNLESITIPNIVTEIGPNAFFNDRKLKYVTIPSGVTAIKSNALSGCNKLETVSLPNTLVNMQGYCFDACWSLKSIVIPNTVTTYGTYLFRYNYELSEVILGKGLTTTADYMFDNCYGLESVTIHEGMTTLGERTFNTCYNLQSVTLPSSLTTLGTGVFYNCRSLSNIQLPDGVKVGNSAFYNCYTLESTGYGSTLNATIGAYAYSSCYNLIVFAPPEGVTTIGTNACENCKGLSYITIPSTCTSIGKDAFIGCAAIKWVKFKPLTPPTFGASSSTLPCADNTKIIVPFESYELYFNQNGQNSYYPDSSVYTYMAFGTFENGVTLPTSSDNGSYTYEWYASITDAESGGTPITTGNGKEVYALVTQKIVSIIVDFLTGEMVKVGNPQSMAAFAQICRCAVTDNGEFKRSSESGYAITGTKGQVMSYIPKFYYKVTPITLDGDNIRKAKWEVADTKIDNTWKVHPAFIDANGNEVDYFMYSTFETVGQSLSANTYNISYTTTDYKLASCAPSGGSAPSNNFTRDVARSMAARRGEGWSVAGYKQTAAIQMLMGIEFGFNAQVAIGNGVTSGSVRNCNYAGSEKTYGSKTKTTDAVTYRGIENMWGNTFSMIDGINVNGSTVYICDDLSFADDTSTGYSALSFSLPSSGWSTAFGYDANNDWALIPSETTSTDSHENAIGDYFIRNDNEGWCVPWLGGYNADGQGVNAAGMFYWNMGNALSIKASFIGMRMMYMPTAVTQTAPVTVARQTYFTTAGWHPLVPAAAGLTNSRVYANINRCNVADDGTINAYYGDAGYTEDGSNGQVMVYIPKFYYRFTPFILGGVNITEGRWEISDKPRTGFTLHPAFKDANGNEVDYFLFGAFDAVGQDTNGDYATANNTTSDKLSSVAGSSYLPTSTLTRATARAMASNRGIGWYPLGVKQLMAVIMLFSVEFGFNAQTSVGYGVVSTSSGVKYAGQTTGNITYGTTSKAVPVNWRGIENLWGNIWQLVDGINISSGIAYICDTLSFVDDTSTGYTAVSFSLPTATTNSVINIGYDSNNDWILFASNTDNSSNASGVIGDKIIITSIAGWRIGLFGGQWTNNTDAGIYYWYGEGDSTYATANCGARLMYVPTANV